MFCRSPDEENKHIDIQTYIETAPMVKHITGNIQCWSSLIITSFLPAICDSVTNMTVGARVNPVLNNCHNTCYLILFIVSRRH